MSKAHTKWEYLDIVCTSHRDLHAQLEKFGDEGWEAYNVKERSNGFYRLYLKRPKL